MENLHFVLFAICILAGIFAAVLIHWEPKANPGSWLIANDWRGRVGYFLVYLNGKMSGLVDHDLSRRFIQDDVRRCRKSLEVLTRDADENFWTEDVLQVVEEKAICGVEFRFIVGPNARNRWLESLAERGLVVLNRSQKNPQCDIRIIDQDSTYIVTNGDTDRLWRKYEYTHGNVRALKDRGELFTKFS